MVLVVNKSNNNFQFEKPQITRQNQRKEIEIISDLLTGICEESNKNKDNNSSFIKPFLSKKIPSISICDFLERIVKYTKMQDSTLMLILIYIDRFCEINYVNLNFFNIHKLIIASMIVAIKYNEDNILNNEFYAKVGGVSKKEIDILEYEFLSLIEFSLYVDEETFHQYDRYVQNSNFDY